MLSTASALRDALAALEEQADALEAVAAREATTHSEAAEYMRDVDALSNMYSNARRTVRPRTNGAGAAARPGGDAYYFGKYTRALFDVVVHKLR